MVALHGLNATASLLRQLSARAAPSLAKPDPVFSSAPTLKDEFLKGVSAEKMVGSATFNALASLSEKRAADLKDVLKYIDKSREAAAGGALSSLEGEAAQGVARMKEASSRARQYVLDHPDAVLDILDKIRTSRPELSKDQAMAFLMQEIGKKIGAYSDSASSAVAISASGAAMRQDSPSAA